MRMKSLYFLSAVPFLIPMACSSLFWRSAALSPDTVSSGGTTITYQVVYLERDSWNPMMGTTVKKSYQTRLTLSEESGSDFRKDLPNLRSWVLPGKLSYHEGTDRLFWIQGVDDEYGTLNRKAGIADRIREKGLSQTKFWEKEKELLHLSPSPDGERVAFVFSRSGSAGMPEYFVTVWNHTKETEPNRDFKIPTWDESDGTPNPEYDLIWATGDRLSVKLGEKTMTWTESGFQ